MRQSLFSAGEWKFSPWVQDSLFFGNYDYSIEELILFHLPLLAQRHHPNPGRPTSDLS